MKQREVRRTGHASDIGASLAVQSNRLRCFGVGRGAARPAQVGAEQERIPVGAEPGNEGILAAGVSALECARHREVRRVRRAGDVRTAARVHRDAGAAVVAFPTEIGAVQQAASIRAEFGDESVLSSMVASLHPGRREVGGRRVTHNVRISPRIQRNPVPVVRGVAAQVGAKDQAASGETQLQDERVLPAREPGL